MAGVALLALFAAGCCCRGTVAASDIGGSTRPAVSPPVSTPPATDSLAPARDWRVTPRTVAASHNTEALDPLRSARSARWNAPLAEEPWIAMELPDDAPRLLATFQTGLAKNIAVVLEGAAQAPEAASEWREIDRREPGQFLEKFEIEPNADNRWVRLRFVSTAAPDAAPAPGTALDVQHLGLYALEPGRRHDYWLVIGASIQWQSIQQETFHRFVVERHPDYDPVIFNLAVSGWRTGNLLDALPRFLAQHSCAEYVCIHIGGNNVSPNRPYPGGAEQLELELGQILVAIRDAGKTPILSRLSYRAYKSAPAVPPEDNGSGPYVRHVYDPLIERFCPAFYDPVEKRGRVDAYGWFRDRPEELSGDGIHVNHEGGQSWNRLWAVEAGDVVYR